MALLELNDVAYAYGKQKVVQDLSLTLQPGEIGCLLGPSGCGKTTVLRCIAGFEQVSNGVIRVAGELISSRDTHLAAERRRIVAAADVMDEVVGPAPEGSIDESAVSILEPVALNRIASFHVDDDDADEDDELLWYDVTELPGILALL